MISIAHSRPQSKPTHLQMNVFCIVFIRLAFFSQLPYLTTFDMRIFYMVLATSALLLFKGGGLTLSPVTDRFIENMAIVLPDL